MTITPSRILAWRKATETATHLTDYTRKEHLEIIGLSIKSADYRAALDQLYIIFSAQHRIARDDAKRIFFAETIAFIAQVLNDD